jgi:hypothetical protein
MRQCRLLAHSLRWISPECLPYLVTRQRLGALPLFRDRTLSQFGTPGNAWRAHSGEAAARQSNYAAIGAITSAIALSKTPWRLATLTGDGYGRPVTPRREPDASRSFTAAVYAFAAFAFGEGFEMDVTHGYQPGVLPTELDPLAVLSEEADVTPWLGCVGTRLRIVSTQL